MVFFIAAITCSGGTTPPSRKAAFFPRQVDSSDQDYYANAHPYLEEPLEQLVKRIPELKKIQPAADQEALPGILEKIAGNVDSFFQNVVNLIAQEKITLEKLNVRGQVKASERVQDNYLILRHDNDTGDDMVEYRMDAAGHRMDQIGLDKGYLVTSGFALSCKYFSTDFQREAKFRYLGEQKIGLRDTFVVAFAQQPGLATLFVTMAWRGHPSVRMLIQGIAWVDKSDFQIIRMRTDLLAPRTEIGLDRQTTEVTFDRVQLPDVATPLWLPSDVQLNIQFAGIEAFNAANRVLIYHNEHHYTDYRRHQVSVKMITPQ